MADILTGTNQVPRLFRLPAVIERTCLSRTQIYRLMDRGDFPRPIKLSERAIAWPSEAIEEWIDHKLETAA